MRDENGRKQIELQRDFLLAAADQIAEGVPIDAKDRAWVAALLRDVAQRMKYVAPPGRPPEFDATGAGLMYSRRRSLGDNDDTALGWLVTHAQVTAEAIKQKIGTTVAERESRWWNGKPARKSNS